MPLVKGIISFPTLFTPKVAQGATEAKFSCSVLLPPNDPQVATIQAEVEQAKLNTFPNGYTGTDECLTPYDTKYAGKDYYDPQFSGWWVFSCTAKAEDRPAVVDLNRTPVIDPAKVYSGMVAYVNAGISGYVKGRGGIGGWLNGVMITEEEPPKGRLDGKPSVDQMFAGVEGGAPAPQQTAPTQAPAPQQTAPTQAPAPAPAPATAPAPAPAPAPQPAPTPAPVALQMTAAANGNTYEGLKAQGYSDQQMIDNGWAIKPSFA